MADFHFSTNSPLMWCAISVEGLAFELICVVPLYFSTSFEILENQSRSRVTCSWKAAEIKGLSEFSARV